MIVRLPLPDEVAERQAQRGNDDEVEFAPGVVRNRLGEVDLARLHEAIRREFERPGKEEGEGEAECDEDDDGLDDPVRCAERVEQDLADLHGDPADHDIGHTDTNDVASFEFLEQTGHPYLRSLFSRR